MEILAAILILFVALAAVLLSSRHRNLLIGLAVGSFAVALGGVGFLLLAPEDLLSRYPALTVALHPYRVGLWVGVCIVLGVGILLGLVAREAHSRFCAKEPANPSGDV